MILHKVSLEGAVIFTRLSVLLVCTWPPSGSATKWEIAKEDFAWCFSILSVLCLLIPLINSIYEYITNPIILTQAMCFCSACAIIIMKSFVLRLHRKKFQILVDEMREFLHNCCENERRVLQSYLEKCWVYHMVTSLMNYLASFCMIISPFVISDQKMPTPAVYPFSIESGIPMCLIFIHQSLVGLQTSAALTVDCQMAMMMWFAGARLEILANEIKDICSIEEMQSIIKKHQQLLSYATRVSQLMSHIAFITTLICGVASIMCCIQFVGNQSLVIKMQFGPVTIVGLTSLMICTWPAENMIRVCDLIGTAVYNTRWIDMSPKLMRNIIMILQMSQQPVQVPMGGIFPALSFRFYTSFLSTVVSCFTTIRLVISNDKE